MLDQSISASLTLRQFRESQDLSQTALAQKLGVSRPHLCNIEAGRIAPGLGLAARIEKLAGIQASAWVLPRKTSQSSLKPERVQEEAPS